MGLAYLNAWATVRDIPAEPGNYVENLQNRLRNALEREHEIADALECEPREILDYIESLRSDVEDAENAKDEAEQEAGTFEHERDEAREQLDELKNKIKDLGS